MFPEDKRPHEGNPAWILLAVVLFVVSLGLPSRPWGSVLQMLSAVLLAITCRLLGVLLLIYIVFLVEEGNPCQCHLALSSLSAQAAIGSARS